MGLSLKKLVKPALHIGAAIFSGGATIPASVAYEQQRAQKKAEEEAAAAHAEAVRKATEQAKAEAERVARERAALASYVPNALRRVQGGDLAASPDETRLFIVGAVVFGIFAVMMMQKR